MSNANPTPTPAVVTSPKIAKAVEAIVLKEGEVMLLVDKLRAISVSECVRLAITGRKALTALLQDSGLTDAARRSEMVGFVFPEAASQRKNLDTVVEFNIAQKDTKKRYKKAVLLALQRDASGKLTIEQAVAQVAKAEQEAATRKAGGQTNQTATPTTTGGTGGTTTATPTTTGGTGGTTTATPTPTGPALTKKQQAEKDESDLGNLIASAMNFAKSKGYDVADFAASADTVRQLVWPESAFVILAQEEGGDDETETETETEAEAGSEDDTE